NKRKKKNVGAVVIDAANILDTTPPSTIKAEDNDNQSHGSSSDDSDLSTDDDFANDTALPVIRKKKKIVKVTVSSKNDLLFSQKKITVDQIPTSAKHVLQVLNKCKKIVKYVKMTGINNDIKQEGDVTLHQSCIVRWLSMSNLLESMLKSFKATKRLLLARNKHSLINDLDLATLKQLVLVLKPLKHIMTLVQTGNLPSLHMVLLCTLTLKRALSSYTSLVDYVSNGFVSVFLNLIDELFNLDVRHYCATIWHPKYKLLKRCTTDERSQCHKYVRQQLRILRDEDIPPKPCEPPSEPQQKKFKTVDTLFTCFQHDYAHDNLKDNRVECDYESDEYEYDTNQLNELDQYLIMKIDKSSITNNSLDFWRCHTKQFLLLCKLVKRIYSIPATSCNVER
ncbi:unnamed protein product, partial [Rotaria sp. Silwood2]